MPGKHGRTKHWTNQMKHSDRRTFAKQLGMGITTAAIGSTARAASANEEVRVALIGCGIRGNAFRGRVVAVCDPDENRLAKAIEANELSPGQAVTDLRRILDDQSIDAVVIATPDHWHAPAAILACQAGKHVYVEKPVSHNLRESRLLQDAAKKHGVVAQHGTQQRSRPFIREAIQSLHEGIIGEVLIAKAWNIQKRKNIGHHQPSQPPERVDYDTWIGPAEHVPFQENRFHTDWHWWRNFGTGDIGNDGTHDIDYARWGLGVDTLPSRVSAIGGKYFFNDQQEFPDTATCVAEYPGDNSVGSRKQLMFEMRLWSRNYPINCDSGVEFLGTEGMMTLSKRGKLFVRDLKNKVITEKKVPKRSGFLHFDNFIDAIKNGTQVNAPLEEAHRTVGLVHLFNISQQLGRTVDFDPTKEEVRHDPEANSLLGRTYREGGHWSVPKSV